MILRDGPGTWAKYANWDEYLLSIDNQTGGDIQIAGAHIVDSMGFQHPSDSNRRRLVKASKETINRYKKIDISISAGYGGGAAMISVTAQVMVFASVKRHGSTRNLGTDTLFSVPLLLRII